MGVRPTRLLMIAVVLAGLTVISPGARAQRDRAAAPAAACSPAVPHVSGATAKLAAAGNGFAFRLYDALAGNNTTGNIFLSPASVELALDMAYDGARGATAQGMARALGLGSLSAASVRRQAASLLASLQAAGDPKAALSIASSLWARNGVRLRSRFSADAAHDFGARVTHLDFAGSAAVAAINSWVSCATHGTIPSILQRIPSDVMLYLLNAVYFQGQWTAPFNPKETHVRPFTTGSGGQVQVPMMDRIGTYPYYAGAHVQVAALPYGNGRFQMVVAVPDGSTSLRSFRSQLTPRTWTSWIAGLRPAQGEVALPRFSVANTFQLNSALSSLGMGQAFSDSADFGGMCVQPCRLSEVRHKTFLTVGEEGTTASAATSVGVVPVAIPQASFHFLVNRPFFLAIRDSTTGAILFWGGINEP
jgi:serpin B